MLQNFICSWGKALKPSPFSRTTIRHFPAAWGARAEARTTFMIALPFPSTRLVRLCVWLAALLPAGSLLAAAPALADLRLCNMTSSRVGVSLGYRDGQGWVTEGWWNLNSRS